MESKEVIAAALQRLSEAMEATLKGEWSLTQFAQVMAEYHEILNDDPDFVRPSGFVKRRIWSSEHRQSESVPIQFAPKAEPTKRPTQDEIKANIAFYVDRNVKALQKLRERYPSVLEEGTINLDDESTLQYP